MAEFILVKNNQYKISGILTENDINRMNTFKNRTTIILDNTVGLSSELISKIKSDRIVFSIKGGLDYETQKKYRAPKYFDRTLVSPSGLRNIIRYFEYNESLIDPNWNEFEKAMFLYNALVVDMEYDEKYDNIQSEGITERSLNGILYGKLVCAGFSLVYKEMLDRIGIKCFYQNQKGVHAFNVIEINGKQYGVDVTWDNNIKKKNDGKCNFTTFGHDPEFYNRDGHHLYNEEVYFNDESDWETKKVIDDDEKIFDLSLLDMNQLENYYGHIAASINNRKPFRYNLQTQPFEVKYKYLPVNTFELKIKQEATKEYPVVEILDFLKKRNALEIDPQLIEAFSDRRGYLLDMGDLDGTYQFGVDLSLIGIDNYEIDRKGTITFNNGNERRQSAIAGVFNINPVMPEEELNKIFDNLNEYLKQYFNKYLLDVVNNIDTLLENYEYKPNEWDADRAVENDNENTKLSLIVNSRDYLVKMGMSEQKVDDIIQRIKSKYIELHKPYEKIYNKKDQDLDFLLSLFDDLDMVRQVMEYDLQKQVSDEEFISLYANVDYMINLFEKYITIAGDKKFQLDEFDISKEDLQQLLNQIIQDYQKNEIESVTKNQNS